MLHVYCSGLLGGRALSTYNSFNQMMVLKKATEDCIFIVQVSQDRPLHQWSSSEKMVLKRPFISDIGKTWLYTLSVQVSQETELIELL